ncbi:MAG: GxxExxY protein [bacterium]|jgi:GxxExxY protein
MQSSKGLLYKDLTGEIIAAAFNVHNVLGCGLLEKVYENALVVELELRGRNVSSQKEFKVTYREREVGVYYADLIVEGKIVVEVKSVEHIDNVHCAQLLNYLKVSGLRVGLIFNFAKTKLQYERSIV